MKKVLTIISALIIGIGSISAVQIPDKPNPPRLVNDLAGMLNDREASALENKLRQFNNYTTTEIVVVTLKTLAGEDKAMVATEIGHQWGVGQEGFDNGIVLLIKEKTATEKGEVFIAIGYGLEGVIPDATAKRIVEYEILPNFRNGNYYAGIDEAVTTMMDLSLGEFSAKEYNESRMEEEPTPVQVIVPMLMFLLAFGFIFGSAFRTKRRSLGRDLPFWVILSMMGSGSRNRSSWGDFSSGRGGFGGGGGFGGFGGGGFGGGGAGGSW